MGPFEEKRGICQHKCVCARLCVSLCVMPIANSMVKMGIVNIQKYLAKMLECMTHVQH